jgi:hypothetical protein
MFFFPGMIVDFNFELKFECVFQFNMVLIFFFFFCMVLISVWLTSCENISCDYSNPNLSKDSRFCFLPFQNTDWSLMLFIALLNFVVGCLITLFYRDYLQDSIICLSF